MLSSPRSALGHLPLGVIMLLQTGGIRSASSRNRWKESS